MDARVAPKKLGLKDRYAAMTRGLGWQTTYQPMDRVFPYDQYEGIKIHDWDRWEDPFRLTMESYWKYQGASAFTISACSSLECSAARAVWYIKVIKAQREIS